MSTRLRSSARELSEWMRAERQLLTKFVQSAIPDHATQVADQPGEDATTRMLHVGCGGGRDIVDLLIQIPSCTQLGSTSLNVTSQKVRKTNHAAHLEDRAALVLGDAETLADFEEDDFDIANRMTSTPGKLAPEEQERFVQRLCRILKPEGQGTDLRYGESSTSTPMVCSSA